MLAKRVCQKQQTPVHRLNQQPNAAQLPDQRRRPTPHSPHIHSVFLYSPSPQICHSLCRLLSSECSSDVWWWEDGWLNERALWQTADCGGELSSHWGVGSDRRWRRQCGRRDVGRGLTQRSSCWPGCCWSWMKGLVLGLLLIWDVGWSE